MIYALTETQVRGVVTKQGRIRAHLTEGRGYGLLILGTEVVLLGLRSACNGILVRSPGSLGRRLPALRSAKTTKYKAYDDSS